MAPQPQRNEVDAVTRSALERAEKAERELAAARQTLANLQASGARSSPFGPAVELPAQFKGTKSYRLTQQHYRKGRMYQPGEIITVENERPGRSWVLIPDARIAQAAEQLEAAALAPAVEQRANDKLV